MTSIISAASPTVRAIGPPCARVPNGLTGHRGTLPKVGLNPTIPTNAAGILIEPPPSVPTARVAMPSATATALPPLDPPAVRVASHGLVVMPASGLSRTALHPH